MHSCMRWSTKDQGAALSCVEASIAAFTASPHSGLNMGDAY